MIVFHSLEYLEMDGGRDIEDIDMWKGMRLDCDIR